MNRAPAASSLESYIVVQYRGQTIRNLPLPSTTLSVGRTPENGLVLDDALVGVRHAELAPEADAVLLTDLGEGHTLLAGNWLPPHQPTLVRHGTAFQIGPFVITVVCGAPTDTDTAEVPAEPAPARSIFQRLPDRSDEGETLPVPGRGAYLRYLPSIFHEGDFLGRYLQIFEALWEPHEYRQNFIHMYFDPLTSPPHLVDWLGSWTATDLPLPHEATARRRGAHEAHHLHAWRGTRYGMTRALEVLAQVHATISEHPEQPYRLTVTVHSGAPGVDRALIERVLDWSRPAHVVVTLDVRTQEVE